VLFKATRGLVILKFALNHLWLDYSQVMFSSVLTTKLFIPAPREQLVLRPQLIERLNNGLHCKLTLIAAPAGFGKTTLVSQWLAGCQRPVAWLSLDLQDNDPKRFLTYFITALQGIEPNFGEDLLSAVGASPLEPILTALVNSISAIPNNFILVLDDYHLMDAQAVHQIMVFILEYLPAQMHLVITTREDPNLGLARLRARQQLSELRVSDLRFTQAEVNEFLNQIKELRLSSQEVRVLETRTEGWIAGLQLAVLSMHNHQDIQGFIEAFAGDHRYIVDYLVEEVLQSQPETIRNFLLQTSILERLNASLCNAVTGQVGGQARLEALERGHFFLIALDDTRDWYRYHHLFADVLLIHLKTEQPEQVLRLHQRASFWYEQQGLTTDAIRHALTAKDFERAADLIEQAVPAMRRNRQETVLLSWIQLLPNELLQRRPALGVHLAGALLSTGQLEGVETQLRQAELWLEQASEPKASNQELPALIAIFRAANALAIGQVQKTIEHAEQALTLLPETDNLGRGAACGLLGLAHWTTGKLEAAYQAYAECLKRLQKAGHLSDAIGITVAMADIQIVQGRLHQAKKLYEHGLQLATTQGKQMLRGAADMQVGLSQLELEHNNLSTAKQHLQTSQALGELTGLPQNPYRQQVALALLQQAHGDSDTALELLSEAERLYFSDFFPNVRPIAAIKARIWVTQSELGKALAWQHEHNLTTQDKLEYLHEYEHITLARINLAQANKESLLETTTLLERLHKAAQDGGRIGSLIEILILQALTHQAQNNQAKALEALQSALTLAEAEAYIRIFIDQGKPMQQLLKTASQHNIKPKQIQHLLHAFAPTKNTIKPPSLESLSERELEVLKWLNTELSGPELARELKVSLNTLRTHTKNIFSKLEVNNRRAAIRRAEELELI
jgi:LuxR family transcriptional regulator, maltose regulon positive regulatory protein